MSLGRGKSGPVITGKAPDTREPAPLDHAELAAILRRAKGLGIDPVRVLAALGLRQAPLDVSSAR